MPHLEKKKKKSPDRVIQRCVTEKFQGSKLLPKRRRELNKKRGAVNPHPPVLTLFSFSFFLLYVLSAF